MKEPEKPKIVLQLAHAKDCPANYIKNDIDLCPCGYNDNEQKLARWATYAEQEIERLRGLVEEQAGGISTVIDGLGDFANKYAPKWHPKHRELFEQIDELQRIVLKSKAVLEEE